MWLFTDKGFVSTVAYNESKDRACATCGARTVVGKDKTVRCGKHPEHATTMSRRTRKRLGRSPVLARARVRDDLEQIRPFYPGMQIREDKAADYTFRALVPRRAWVDFVASAAEDIDYDSHFKEAASSRSPKASGRHSAMMSVWSAMMKLQPTSPYADSWSTYSGGKTDTLCTSREVRENGSTAGRWCNYGKAHTGKHSFEMGSHDYSGVSQTGKCSAKHATRGYCTFTSGHVGSHSWSSSVTSIPISTSEVPVDEKVDREAGAGDVDTVDGMVSVMLERRLEEVRIDPATPHEAFDLWATACEFFGEATTCTAENVGTCLVDLIGHVRVDPDARRQYVRKLGELGYTMPEDSPYFEQAEPPADAIDADDGQAADANSAPSGAQEGSTT